MDKKKRERNEKTLAYSQHILKSTINNNTGVCIISKSLIRLSLEESDDFRRVHVCVEFCMDVVLACMVGQ